MAWPAVFTAGQASKLTLQADRALIKADGVDLSFITAQVSDRDGQMIPEADNKIKFTIQGPGELIATDNGDATNMTSFASNERNAFNGLCLVIVRARAGKAGIIKVTASADGLQIASVLIKCTP